MFGRWAVRLAGLGMAATLVGCGHRAAPPAVKPTAGAAPVKAAPAPPVARAVAEPVPPPAEPPRPKARIFPASADLLPGDPGLQLVIQAGGDGGETRDWTGLASWRAEPDGIVAIEPGGYVRPRKAGSVSLQAIVEGRPVASATITVAGQDERPWDFQSDIVPIFTRFGCNTGGCHGRADGQNGFHLSLFGYDAEGDLRALTRDAAGRRISPFDPEQSLLVRKATGRTPHGGGLRLPPGSDAHKTLLAWVEAGAPGQRGPTHGAVVEVTVEPPSIRLAEPGPQQLRVVARHADGHLRDVTRLATFRTNDDTAAEVDPNGNARLLRRAETDLIVRYQSAVVPVRIGTTINPELAFDYKALPRANFIDDELFKRLAELRVPPSPPASDAAFLRRVSLDLTGQPPLPEEIRAFLADPDPDKRSKKVDELMGRPEFLKFWLIKLGDLLQITSARFPGGAGYYQEWLQTRFRENAPWDEMVRELLTALGNPNRRGGGAANYALDGPDPKVRAEQTAQRFLGLRLRCAQCHDHPFDVWTQDDYFGLAAFFAKTQLGGAGGPGGMMMARPEVTINPEGTVEHLRTKKPAEPRLLGGETPPIDPKADPRKTLADWMTAPDNPFFARAMANWVWAQCFGKGLADPADDLSAANPPVHPELLAALARHFVEHKYDLRDLIRTVVTSNAYGLSSSTVPGNESDGRLFSHQMARPLTAHQMADALAQATDVPYRYPNRATGTRAIDVFDPAGASTILDTFGRCPRVNTCATVATPLVSLRQSLLLIGGDSVESVDAKVSSLNGYLARLLEYGAEPGDIVENLYLRTVCRPPTEEERSHWTAELAGAPELREAAEDLFWALLNSREFAFNH
jgi:hypothetical protein